MKLTNKKEWLHLFNTTITNEKFVMKEKYKQTALNIAYYQQTVSKNAMLKKIVPSASEMNQRDFPK